MHRAPSMKTLQALHWLDDEKRRKVRDLIQAYFCAWHDSTMRRLDEVLETHGVESIYHKGKLKAEYCNTGDAYAPTIIYRYATDTFSVGSWGDLVERHNWNGEQ